MKALILAGGRGTRLRPLTHTSNKHLIPIGNKPMIERVLQDVIDAGIRDIIINVNKGDTSIQQFVSSLHLSKIKVTYIEQELPNGMMYPIVSAESLIGDDKFILFGADNVLSGGIKKYVRDFEKSKDNASILVTKVEHPERFGVVVVQDGYMKKTVEKPKEFVSDLAATAIYMYDPCVFEAMKYVKPLDLKGDGVFEYYPPPVHQWLVDNGYRVKVTEVTGWWKDTGKPNDLLLANRMILENQELILDGICENSEIEGNVEIMEGAIVKNCRLRGPLSIGRNCQIMDSYIGPFTSIYHNSFISNCEIENSLIMGDVHMSDIEKRIDSSLIGWFADIGKMGGHGTCINLFIGDHSIVRL